MMAARAVYFEAPRDVRVKDVPLEPLPGEAMVISSAMGISAGTELLLYRGDVDAKAVADETLPSLQGGLAYPLKYGYSNAGTTEGGRRVFAFYPHQDRFYAREEDLIALPDGVSPEAAVFIPSLETAVGIVHDARPRTGETVVVVGLGPIGLMVCEVLRRAHYGPVIGIEPLTRRREAAARIGVSAFVPGDGDIGRALKGQSPDGGADVCINTCPSDEALQNAIDVCGFEGRVVDAAWHPSRPLAITLSTSFHRRRLNVKSSQVSHIDPSMGGRWSKGRRMGLVLDLVERIDPVAYITHRFPLERAAEALALIDQHPEETIQVVLYPEET